MSAILTLNAGSSSIKYSVYLTDADEPQEIAVGQIDGIGPNAVLLLKHDGKKTETELGEADHTTGLKAVLAALKPILGDHEVTGVGHRIVHGGPDYADPTILNEQVLSDLEGFNKLAPLHQPHNIAAIRAAMVAFPDAVQVGCFDTGFHRGHDFVNDVYALPLKMYEEGIRRYGFHGLSYDYITGYLEKTCPELKDAKVVIAHLGNGASMTAVQGRRAVASTLGFSAVDGLPMGTRCGQLDPGIMLYLMDKGMSAKELTNLLYKESGMKGLSEISHDMRTIAESDDPRAKQALDYYIERVAREFGSLAAANRGIDAVVFTGGVGEHSPVVRRGVAERLGFLGFSLDDEANEHNAETISNGAVKIMVIPTDEEGVIARAVMSKLS
ncbi:acetate/propionate family kinase [Aliiruegeria sabulilitoris]|uniref:acetate/propionate family kinase n=1 Tax=Aliiruegeria sabulilitoris TaxID=1510458 RepID=UPI00082C4D2E|nr:acetate/propionate family kinase [Aliiruegeria sabulilitoris]NDR59002.1 acetate/propionate family kinase [Pseudoruegeria sp. M32A2M]